MKKLKNVLLVLAMTVMCLVFYYVFVIFVDISNLVKKEPATNIKEEEMLSNTIDGDITPTEPAEEEDKEISIVVFGENFVHDSVIDSGKQSDGTYNYDFLFDNLKMYASEADIAAIYQTTIIGGNDLGVKGYPNFNTPEEMMSAIQGAGFDVALNVLPAPSFSSKYLFAFSKSGLKPYSFSISSPTFGISSIKESS